jgi:two-component system, NarL family, response regulator
LISFELLLGRAFREKKGKKGSVMFTIGKAADHHRLRGARHFGGSAADTNENVAERIREILTAKDSSRGVRVRENGQTMPNREHEEVVSEQRENGQAQTIKVLVADDHPVVREGLTALINRQDNMCVIAEAGNGRDAREKFLAQRPDVTLLDLRMSIMNGIETAMSICEQDPKARLVIITSFESEEDIYRALRAGVQGYILKDATTDELAECIRAVANGKTWIPPQVGAKLAKRVADQELTRREMHVLQAVAGGKSNKEIGVALNISEATVKVHMTHILEKLKVTGRTEAINVAVKRGLVRLDEAAG